MPAPICWQIWLPWSMGEGQTGLLSRWSKEPWRTEPGPSLASATAAIGRATLLDVQNPGIHRSNANFNKAQMFPSVSQRMQDAESVLHCCDCKAVSCDVEGLISWWSYGFRIQMGNICPGGRLLWFRCVVVALG